MSKGIHAASLFSAAVNMLFSMIVFIEAVSALMFSLCTFTDNNGTLYVSTGKISASSAAVIAVALCGYIYSLAVMLGRNSKKRPKPIQAAVFAFFWCAYCIFFSVERFAEVLYPVRLKWYSSLPLININLLQYNFFKDIFSGGTMLSVAFIGISAAVLLLTEIRKSRTNER